jgi:hypothetical protein
LHVFNPLAVLILSTVNGLIAIHLSYPFLNMFHYWGFGLFITSEIEFPELLPAEFVQQDVMISIGTVPASPENISPLKKTISHIVNDTTLLFEVKDVARYYATNGNNIVIEINPDNEEMRSVRLFVLATVFAAILIQRDLLAFHASAIIQDGRLLLITGNSGAGKSTTTAGLIKGGYTLFSDDVIVLNKDDKDDIIATASYPMIKLWNDTLVHLEDDSFSDRSFLVRPGTDKYGIFFHDRFDKSSYPIERIFILKKGDVAQIQTRQLSGKEAYVEVNKHVYRPRLLASERMQRLRFILLGGMLKNCSVYEITRPEEGESREELLLSLKALL